MSHPGNFGPYRNSRNHHCASYQTQGSAIPDSNLPVCPQYPALTSLPDSKNLKLEDEVREEIGSEEFFDKSLKRLQGAVKISTESFDDMGQVGGDPRWDVFVDFHAYLEKTFPLV
jgi:Gly-Xaa carboxypeptidase